VASGNYVGPIEPAAAITFHEAMRYYFSLLRRAMSPSYRISLRIIKLPSGRRRPQDAL
jgi:hypothetical protein